MIRLKQLRRGRAQRSLRLSLIVIGSRHIHQKAPHPSVAIKIGMNVNENEVAEHNVSSTGDENLDRDLHLALADFKEVGTPSLDLPQPVRRWSASPRK